MHEFCRDWQIPRFYDFLELPSFRSQGRCFDNGESDNAERPEVPPLRNLSSSRHGQGIGMK